MRRRFFSSELNVSFSLDKYLTIEALEDGLTVAFTKEIEYGIDGIGWYKLSAGVSTPAIKAGQTISFKGNLIPIELLGIGTFDISKRCNLKGTCMSLLFGDTASNNRSLEDKEYAFYNLFKRCSNIVGISSMFLPATTLAYSCYGNMFSGCTSLTTAPELPATTLATSCYGNMFFGCTSLTTAPELPATTLADSCYLMMFFSCDKLNYIKMLATDISATNCLTDWVSGVASTGTFVKNPDATWEVYGNSGIHNGWTVVMDGEEDVGGGFTANFFFDYCEDFGFYKQCERAPDDLSVACYNEAVRLMELYGVESEYYRTSVDNPQQYGFNVTIEDAQVIEISKEYDALFLHTGGEYQLVYIDVNGLIIYEL